MTAPGTPALPGRLVALSAPEDPTVSPHPTDSPSCSFSPFPFPFFPLSQSCWLTGLAEMFRQRHQRCLAALLVLQLESQQWTTPLLPTQRCSKDGASFRLLPSDYSELAPTCRVAGSFQSARFAGVSDLRALVPPFDGLHLVHCWSGSGFSKSYFLRIAGTLHDVLPEQVMFDDWRAFLHQYRDRYALG